MDPDHNQQTDEAAASAGVEPMVVDSCAADQQPAIRLNESTVNSAAAAACAINGSSNPTALNSPATNEAANRPPPTAQASSSAPIATSTNPQTGSDHTRRSLAKLLIERYFYQLSNGCGNPRCANRDCASSGATQLSPNQAAARAIQMYTQDAKLCDAYPGATYSYMELPIIGTAGAGGESRLEETATAVAASSVASGSDAHSSFKPPTNTSTTPTPSYRPTSASSVSARAFRNPTSSTNGHRMPYPSFRARQSAAATSTADDVDAQRRLEQSTVSVIDDALDESRITRLLDELSTTEDSIPLLFQLTYAYSSHEILAASFQAPPTPTPSQLDALLERLPQPADLRSLKKEDLRSLEGDLDKDEDSSAEAAAEARAEADREAARQAAASATVAASDPYHTSVDFDSLRRSLQLLLTAHAQAFETINRALQDLTQSIQLDFLLHLNPMSPAEFPDAGHIVTALLIVFETILAVPSEFMEVALPAICAATSQLPVPVQARLARIWSRHCRQSLRPLLESLQQLISLQVISKGETFYAQENPVVVGATKVMHIVFCANLLAADSGEEVPGLPQWGLAPNGGGDIAEAAWAAASQLDDADEFFFEYNGQRAQSASAALSAENALATELGVTTLDCRRPPVPYEEFYNEPLSDAIEMDQDYLNYKNRRSDGSRFTFMLNSFILTPATKITALYYDNRIRMYSERRQSMQHMLAGGAGPPQLNLKVRRERIIDDALVGLEMVAMGNPKDLKKQLVVDFAGEQGIDEGGLSKEFFQLVVEQIFNPDYGMFVATEDGRHVWFNSMSFENTAQFTLIGIVLGLAIYNNVILAVNFPMVVYRKLMGGRGRFADLEDWSPELYRSLMQVLRYEGDDMEEVFMLTFRISYANVFGEVQTHDLKADGGELAVRQDNKREFVELYTDYLLNGAVEKQFRAFRRGFEMVTDESPLNLLFLPEEIELLVCGSKKFDFEELENSTEYEGGFESTSQTIVDFWDIVHALPMDSKRKLLEFSTGSDRVPVGGLSRLKLVIARNGPDSDRLPTSHTCFNVLLLPEYSDKQKLEERLLKAINYSKGFGML